MLEFHFEGIKISIAFDKSECLFMMGFNWSIADLVNSGCGFYMRKNHLIEVWGIESIYKDKILFVLVSII